MNKAPLILEGISQCYRSGGDEVAVLDQADFTLRAGEIVALVAPSGSGKSTLLHVAGLLERPTAGQVFIDGVSAENLSDCERTLIRRLKIGFVYQNHHLLKEFTALENVALPQIIAGKDRKTALKEARDILASFKTDHRADHFPGKLSGGERQRVAIGRALANQPSILLADEPTGSLDTATAEIVFAELLNNVRQRGVGALIATHNTDLARRMDRCIRIVNKRTEEVCFA